MKNLEAENPCPIDLLSRGGGQHAVSRKSLVSSRKFNKEIFLARSAHNELSTNDLLLTTKAIGFTMAEILLSLTIIGVVAAITLPSLTGNINERTWNTQKKTIYARIAQAIPLMGSVNGYQTAENFVTSGLSKVLKINNICTDNLADCGVPAEISNLSATKIKTPETIGALNPKIISMSITEGEETYSYSQEDSNAVAFETANGETIITYYNSFCQANKNELASGNWYYAQNKVCINFVYDLNGKKGPNTVGKDIGFISVLYPADSVVVAPNIVTNKEKNEVDLKAALEYCSSMDQEYRLPNIDELTSMFFNQELMNIYDRFFWSSTTYDSNSNWMQSLNNGRRIRGTKTRTDASAVCVKR